MGGHHSHGPKIQQIGPNNVLWNVRAEFKLFAGLLNIGTHMSIVKLSNDKFLVIDTVELSDTLKYELDLLTDFGKKIHAVVATHPFHTLAFPAFYKAYPDAPYYGTPRHLRNLKDIPWAGEISEHLKDWAPDVEMRIPAGAEYVNPQPESSNHFISVWVNILAARTLHIDDTINCLHAPSPILALVGKKKDQLDFHPSMDGAGLLPTPEAPGEFVNWVKQVLKDWDFDNICCAHTGIKFGNAHQELADLLAHNEADILALAKKSEKRQSKNEDCSKYNVKDSECG